MQRCISPICLVLCLAMLVTAFALLSTGAPEPSIDLHRARVMDDEAFTEVLEKDLTKQIWLRRGLITSLFVLAFALGIGAFLSVSGSDP